VGGDRGDEVGDALDPVGADAGGGARAGDDGLAQQVVLRPEPPVHGARRQARLAHDVHDLGAVVALAGEHRGGRLQQPLAQHVGVGSGGRGVAGKRC
jgi:hypothetical protein